MIPEKKKAHKNEKSKSWIHVASITFNLLLILSTTITACLAGEAILSSKTYLLSIVHLYPRNHKISYFLCIISSVMLLISAILSFIAIFATKNAKWVHMYLVISLSPLVLNSVIIVLFKTSMTNFERIAKNLWPDQAQRFFAEYSDDVHVTQMFDALQVEGKCCGITDWADYAANPWGVDPLNTYIVVPDSCCKGLGTKILQECRNGDMMYIHGSGCHARIRENITGAKNDIQVVSISLICLMVVEVICVVLVMAAWRNEHTRRRGSKTVIVRL